MKDYLISSYIDDELDLDEKIEFVETVHAQVNGKYCPGNELCNRASSPGFVCYRDCIIYSDYNIKFDCQCCNQKEGG